MFYRTSTIKHKQSGVTKKTPLLVPSFSSKGFELSETKSEVGIILQTASEIITDTYLISAYDIAKGYIPKPQNLTPKPDLIIVDSGGYEISNDQDLSSVNFKYVKPKVWTLDEWKSIIKIWPKELPAIIVNYDHPSQRRKLSEQIEEAQESFKGLKQLTCFLLKQETKDQTTLKEVIAAATSIPHDLMSFDIIGLTEKGLGASPLERMLRIAKLRRALDEADLDTPIHIFGSLDPVSICIYFIAGAEIFDGLTWLRYAFADDQCIYRHCHATLTYGIETTDAKQRARVMADNYYYLEKLAQNIRHFASTKDYKVLPHWKFMVDVSKRLEAEMKKG